jgi:hypothetical protein
LKDKIAILIFIAYLAVGLLVYEDYGISIDEGNERETSLVNYVYVMGEIMRDSPYGSVNDVAQATPELHTWPDRYYGTALQSIPVLIEHIRGFEMPTRDIFLMRHLFTFINFYIGAVFFYLLLRRRFRNTFFPLVGALFFILYPRFFGESFFNIKDMLFVAWVVISVYCVLRWLEKGRVEFLFLSALTIAIATNTRILGLMILLIAFIFSIILTIQRKENVLLIVIKPILLVVLTITFYVAITPFLWANPIGNMVETITHFIQFDPWNSTHFFLGEMITSSVPWFYIPVWMVVTIPILYLVLFAIGVVSIVIGIVLRIRKREADLRFHELFFSFMFFGTLFGYITLSVTMYEGWRHAYILFIPFLYIAVYGLYKAYMFAKEKHNYFRLGVISVVMTCLCVQLAWMVVNHPYQYVYFNSLGKRIAEENFTLDYWEVSHLDMIRFLLDNDGSQKIRAQLGESMVSMNMLTKDERNRITPTDIGSADFYLQDSRMGYMSRITPPGFSELTSIKVDKMRISTLYKRMNPAPVMDRYAWDNIVRFESNVNKNSVILHDFDYDTRWSTGRPQEAGDFMMFEFGEPVDYNYISMVLSPDPREHPLDLTVSISQDGVIWTEMPVTGNYQFVKNSEPYQFLKFEVGKSDVEIFDIVHFHSRIFWKRRPKRLFNGK